MCNIMYQMPKLSEEAINETVESFDFVYIKKSYSVDTQKLNVICPDGHKTYVDYTNFKTNINKCVDCPTLKTKRTKITIDYLREIVEAKEFTLLDEEYKGNGVKINYLCEKGHKNSSTIGNFRKMTHGCKTCAYEISGKNQQLSFNEVVKAFTDVGFTLLSTEDEFDGVTTLLKYVCDKGHENEIIIN